MRHIELAEGLRIRFPGRSEEFDEGVEVGVAAALMESGLREFSRWTSPESLIQVRELAEKLGYRLVESAADEGWTRVTFRFGQARPQLKIVHSRG
jgi:hypothetical protein